MFTQKANGSLHYWAQRTNYFLQREARMPADDLANAKVLNATLMRTACIGSGPTRRGRVRARARRRRGRRHDRIRQMIWKAPNLPARHGSAGRGGRARIGGGGHPVVVFLSLCLTGLCSSAQNLQKSANILVTGNGSYFIFM